MTRWQAHDLVVMFGGLGALLAGCVGDDAVVGAGASNAVSGSGGADATSAATATAASTESTGGGSVASSGSAGTGGSAPSHALEWASGFSDADYAARATGVNVDPQGNVWLSGTFDHTLDLGSTTVVALEEDVYLAKFDGAGALLTAHSYGVDGRFQAASDMVLDGDNVVVVGAYGGALDLGDGPLPVGDYYDALVAKFDASGAVIWSIGAPGSGYDDLISGAAVDTGHNIVVTGSYASSDFAFPGELPLVDTGNWENAFVTKLDAAGDHQWTAAWPPVESSRRRGVGVATDASNEVFVTGTFDGDFDAGKGTMTTMGYQNAFLIKLSPDGNTAWSQRFGEFGSTYANAIVADASGNATIVGKFDDTINLGGDVVVSQGGYDAFVAQFSSSGTLLWKKIFGGLGDQSFVNLSLTASGGLLLAGYFQQTVDYGGGPFVDKSTCPAPSDCWDGVLLELDASGNYIHSRQIGGTGDDWLLDIEATPAGGFVISGMYSTSVDFGNGTPLAGGDTDAFLAKYGP